jgi:hypothetical protein
MSNNNNDYEYLDFARAFVCFCTFFERYRLDNLYKNMSGSNVGSFKANYSNDYAILRAITKFDLNKSNFTNFLATITKETLKHEPNRAHFSYSSTRLISDCRDLNVLFCNEASNNLQDHRDCFTEFMRAAEEIYEINGTICSSFLQTPGDMTTTEDTRGLSQVQPQQVQPQQRQLRSSSTLNLSQESSLAESIISSDAFTNFFKNMNEELGKVLDKKLDSTVSAKIANEISRHFGVEKELTSDMIEKQKLAMSNTYNKILRKKNDVSIFKTHLKHKTSPAELCHKRFPRPFLQHDHFFVEKYNHLLEKFQTEIMELATERLNEQIEILNNDFNLHKRTLSNYIKVEDFERYVIAKESTALEPEFERASEKCLSVRVSRYEPTSVLIQEHDKLDKEKLRIFNNNSIVNKNNKKPNNNNRNKPKHYSKNINNINKNSKKSSYNNNNNFKGLNNNRSRSNTRENQQGKSKATVGRVFFNSNHNQDQHRSNNSRAKSCNPDFRKRTDSNQRK